MQSTSCARRLEHGVISAEWHPDEERLLSRYLEPDVADDSCDQHLAWCHACGCRLTRLAGELDGLHDAAATHADLVFDHARLAAQRRAVQARLGASLPGRILPFPTRDLSRHASLSRVAAAVLVVALSGAGVLRLLSFAGPRAPQHTSALGSDRAIAAAMHRPHEVTADVLEDIDHALVRPQTAELRALDELTPHVRDVAAPLR